MADALNRSDPQSIRTELLAYQAAHPNHALGAALLAVLHQAQAGQPIADLARLDPPLPDPETLLTRDERAATVWSWERFMTEAQQRIAATAYMPPWDTWPAGVLAAEEQGAELIVVDGEQARLWLLQRIDRGWSVRDHFFVSFGRAGLDKFAEGDRRTPIGVYHILQNIPGSRLPDLYGNGALTLNYPNALDRREGRTGSGIWIHGTPPNEFVRTVWASDGCVVGADPDLERLRAVVGERRLPVLVVPRIDWQAEPERMVQRDDFITTLEAFHLARGSGSAQLIRSFLDAQFRGSDPVPRLRVPSNWALAHDQLLLLAHGPHRYVQYRELRRGEPTARVRAQYWAHTEAGWRLVSDRLLQTEGGT